MSYSFSRGGVSLLIPKKEKSLAYCIEPPHHVFEEIFPDYFVTNYKGVNFFEEEKLKQGDKAYGLGIKEIDLVLAGGVRLEKILEFPFLEKFKREKKFLAKKLKKYFQNLMNNRECLKF